MAGPPLSARSFFKDPRSLVEQCADGQKVLRLRTGPSRLVSRYAARRAKVAAMLDGSAAGAKEKPSATIS